MDVRGERETSESGRSVILDLQRKAGPDRIAVIAGRILKSKDSRVGVYNYDPDEGQTRLRGKRTAISFDDQQARSVFENVSNSPEYQALRLAAIGDINGKPVWLESCSCPLDSHTQSKIMAFWWTCVANNYPRGSMLRRDAKVMAYQLTDGVGLERLRRYDIIDVIEPVVEREWNLVVGQTDRTPQA